jgi:2-succinyl-6-hydroxy-2,4-cyclohexadiene-1-carboxylate synthase
MPVNGVELAVERHGHGDPFVLLHGFTGGAVDWAGVVEDLAARREVITVEHRGHGASTNTGDAATYTFDQLVADFAQVADDLDLERFDLLGHSMGGIVAMRYALAHPERLRSLVLMDTGAAASPEGPQQAWMRAGFELSREGGMTAVYEVIAPFLGEGEAGERARAEVRAKYDQVDPVAFRALGEELLVHPSVLDRLATLAVPTTVLVGEHDTGLRPESDALAATIPGAVLVVIPDAAHSPQAENRSAWLAAVFEHLERTQ